MPPVRGPFPRARWRHVLHAPVRTRLLHILATILAIVGAVLCVWAVVAAIDAPFDETRLLLLTALPLAAIACSRFPLRLGVSNSIISLDSIPLVFAVLMLELHDAVLIGVITTVAALIGQRPRSGIMGWFWHVQTPLVAAPAMAAASTVAQLFGAGSSEPRAVLLVPALIVALALEAAFNSLVLLELEATEPGSGRHLLDAAMVPAANVMLPTVAAAGLTPYIDDLWAFALLFPVMLFGMYGALWVANSQQLEKRRGARLKDTFSRYVPEGIVDDNLETMQQVELGGEQVEISVLFCDIRGFTSWSENKGATEVITELNVLLTELSASVMDTGGTLDKFTGDGLMAFWGAPVPNEYHAEFACRAALDMLDRLEEVNERRLEEGQEPFAIGVAVHSGPAVVGNVGHERRLDYTAIGDTVNTAAQLEASTKELGAVLVVSRATVDRLYGDLHDRALKIGDVMLKGKSKSVEAFALPPLRPELDALDGEDELRAA